MTIFRFCFFHYNIKFQSKVFILVIVKKYNLDISNTYYVGDRDIDMVYANNCGFKGILFVSNTCNANVKGHEDIEIHSLSEMLKII